MEKQLNILKNLKTTLNLKKTKTKNTIENLKSSFLKEINQINNRDLQNNLEKILQYFNNDKQVLQFLISLNLPKRAANRSFNYLIKIYLQECIVNDGVDNLGVDNLDINYTNNLNNNLNINTNNDLNTTTNITTNKRKQNAMFLFKILNSILPDQIKNYKRKSLKQTMNDILEEINLLILFADKLYQMKGNFESFIILDYISQLILFINKFPIKHNTLIYFKILFNIFMSRGYFFISLNIFYRILEIEKKTNLKKDYFLNLINLMNLKNNDDDFHKFLCGLKIIYKNDLFMLKDSILFDQEVEHPLKIFSLDNFTSLIEEKGKIFKMSDCFRNYISFMKLNNFEYFISHCDTESVDKEERDSNLDSVDKEGKEENNLDNKEENIKEKRNFFFNGNWCKKSNSQKIFEITNSFKKKYNFIDSKKVENMRIKNILEREKQITLKFAHNDHDQDDGKDDNKENKDIKEKDENIKENKKEESDWIRKFNLFLIYQMEKKNILNNIEEEEERQEKIEKDFHKKREIRNRTLLKYKKVKLEIEKILRKKEVKIKINRPTNENVNENVSSWRYQAVSENKSESENKNVYQFKGDYQFKGKENKNIYTFNENNYKFKDTYKNKENTYKFKENKFKDNKFKKDDNYKFKENENYKFKKDDNYKFKKDENTYKFNENKFKDNFKDKENNFKKNNFYKPPESFENLKKSKDSLKDSLKDFSKDKNEGKFYEFKANSFKRKEDKIIKNAFYRNNYKERNDEK